MSLASAVLVTAVVVAAGMWSLRVVAMSDLDGLPARCRRRIRWWQLNARWVYVCCAVVAAGATVTHFSG